VAIAISAALVKTLRDRTGLGMMQCKEALAEAGGDMEKAVDVLRQKGLKSADKKADRATSQGRIGALVKGNRAVLIELNCESDFVAINEAFVALLNRLCVLAADAPNAPASPEAFLGMSFGGTTIEAILKDAVAKTGENIRLRSLVRYDAPAGAALGFYIHPPGRIAVLMEGSGAQDPAKAEAALRDVCMHVAAVNPVSVSPDDIPAAVLEREKAVYAVQIHGKPPQVAEKMLKGKLEAFFAERCLVRQAFVKNPTVTVADHLKAAAAGLSVKRFVRLEIGA